MPRIARCRKKQFERARKLIVGILVREFSLENIPRPDIEDILGTYQSGNGQFWIATEKEDIVGTLAVQDYGDGRLRMRRFMVAKEWRGRGLAQELLAVCIDHAKSKDAKAIVLSTVPELARANRFYVKMGFKKTDKPGWFPDTEDRIFFMLELISS